MQRREFLLKTGLAVTGLATGATQAAVRGVPTPSAKSAIRWKRSGSSNLFTSVTCDGEPCVAHASPGLLDGRCRLGKEAPGQAARLGPAQPSAQHGPLRVALHHTLHDSESGYDEDLLEASLTIRNESDQDQQIEVTFVTSVQPSQAPTTTDQQIYLPLSAAGLSGDRRFTALGVKSFLKDCQQSLGKADFECHYLEPNASDPTERTTKALMLAPVVDLQPASASWHAALFTPSDHPAQFRSSLQPDGTRVWQVGRVINVPAGGTHQQRCWLLLHTGDASVAWKAFHRFAHREEHRPIDWVQAFKVHYYDFLSSAAGKNGHRGDGYEAAVPLFREFHVGLATQHGYYPTLGDYIHPDRSNWLAMRGDKQGPVEMSFEKIRERLQATRAAGAKAAIYLHPVLFDDATPFFGKMRDCILVDAEGQLVPFPWQGPDTEGKNWRASLASPEWRAHLLQQADWILDLLRPDALVVDETFAGIGYDYHPNHAGPTSAAAIDWHRQLQALARSYGPDKAVFTSDCSMSPFVLWADGEVGDHAYSSLLGHPLYAQEPVRYLAALGGKPWRPCAWHFTRMWDLQMKLARQVGSGVGVSNGWLEYNGLHGLPVAERRRLVNDIETIL